MTMCGTGAQAAVKDIVIYASGDAKAIAKTARMFSDFSRATFNVGDFGNGSRMKYVANLLVTIHNVASAEAMVLGIKSGLDPQMVYDLIRTGAGTSRVFELRGPMMVQDRYDDASMSIKLYHKDIAVIEDHAAKLGVPTPLFSASIPVYSAALSMGYGAQDTASVCGGLQTMAGVKRGKARKRASKKVGKAKRAHRRPGGRGAELVIGPAHPPRPPAGPMASVGRTRLPPCPLPHNLPHVL